MKSNKIQRFLSTRMGFLILAVLMFWLKTYLAYQVEFELGVTGALQQFILVINPVATTIFILGLSLYAKKPKMGYTWLFILLSLSTLLLYANIIYYREFTDFLTVNTILGAKSVSNGLSGSSFALFNFRDILYLADIAVLAGLLISKWVKVDAKPFKKRYAFAVTALSCLIFSANLSLAETSRPQLLTRTFDRNYIVKYLGLNVFTAYDGVKTAQANQVRAQAAASDAEELITYINENYAAPNDVDFGRAAGKNVIYIHLESFQQFLIDYQLEDENGELHTVTPFLNSLYHNQSTLSFSNFFHQVGQGKTSDAETLLENSLFGLPQGSVFTSVGTENTFEAAPAILRQNGDYTSASFHGNGGTFWNRNNTYKSFGYDYFFDAAYYDDEPDNKLEYGVKDKIFFQESVQYLENLPQPFYAKFLTVTNHFPYPLDSDNANFPRANTGDSTIDGYFATANYLDQSVEEFFNYLKESGLYDNSIIVLYGDHYGISNTRNKTLAELLGKDSKDWNSYDNAMLQRVPFMIHIPGQTGGIYEQFGGQVDVLPTLLHLLGIDNKDYPQLGTDLLSADHNDVVVFRNGDFVSPKYTKTGSKVYDTATGELLEDLTEEQQTEIDAMSESVETRLNLSDSIINRDLLRFYAPPGFKEVQKDQYDYRDQVARLQEMGKELGSELKTVVTEHDGQSTIDMYVTDAPELNPNAATGSEESSTSTAPKTAEEAYKE